MRAVDVVTGGRTVRRRYRALPLGLACLTAAALLGALADDVRRWPTAVRGGDVQVRLAALRADPWPAPDRLPFHPVERFLGVTDDLEYRRAARLFVLGRRYRSSSLTGSVTPAQEAQRRLLTIERRAGDLSRRSAAANMRGVLTHDTAEYGESGSAEQALRRFRDAVRIDPSNEQAKFNLELMLARTEVPRDRRGAGGRVRGVLEAEGAGSTPPGRGY